MTSAKKRPGAPAGSRNAAKPDAERRSVQVRLRLKPVEEASWLQAAAEAGVKLSDFVRSIVNREIGHE